MNLRHVVKHTIYGQVKLEFQCYCHRTAIVTIVKIYIFESQFKCQSRVNKFDILYNIINHIERGNQ